MRDIAISAKNLSFTYSLESNWQLGPLSFDVSKNKMTGLIGANGSGKSSVLRMLALRKKWQGEISIFGKNVKKYSLNDFAKTLGYLPQKTVYQYNFSVIETVGFGRYPHSGAFGFFSRDDKQIIENCLEETDLKDLRYRKLNELSGGELQRVFLASVLAQEPKILILDEPTSALDINHQVAFYELLQNFCEKNITVLIATHDLMLAACYCDELLLLRNGQLEKNGKPDDVINETLLHKAYGNNIKINYLYKSKKIPVIIPEKFDK